MSGNADNALASLHRAAAERGFHVVGVASGEPVTDALRALDEWVAAGHHADLGWMGRHPPERADPRTLLASVRSVVTVAVNHGPPEPFDAEGRYGRVARYAWGLDYHDLVLPRLKALAEALEGCVPGVTRTRVACDHSPLLERAFAVRAGLGFYGKNTCLLLPRRGSWYLLGEILLDADLPSSPPASSTEHCGTCVRCLDACPTNALTEPYVLDARQCLSYLTIEHRGPVPQALREALGPWVFGCDVCQEVCPFNRYAEPTTWPELEAEAGVGHRLDLADLLSIRSDEVFRARFRGTPLVRPKRRGLLRNAAIAARNVGATTAVPALEACVREDAEPLIRAHALWALFGLAPERVRPLAERALAADADEIVREEARVLLAGGS